MKPIKIAIGADHAAFELKEFFCNVHFPKQGILIEWIDLGTNSPERVDYPDFAKKVCHRLITKNKKQKADLGVLLCGSGIGMSIAANKFTGIRAALCHTTELAKLAREHNNANVLCIGARTHTKTQAKKILATFLTSHFEGGRHAKRLKKIR